MALKSLLRWEIILPAIFAFSMTSYPTRLGFYRFIFSSSPALMGMIPAYFPNGEAEWGFTLEDLYGDGGNTDEASAKEYRNRLWGQTALVTGSNSGVGFDTALALARLGVTVTMACRSPARCEAAAKKIRQDEVVLQRAKRDRGIVDPESASDIITMTVDTSSLKSVKKFCEEFLDRTDDGNGSPMPLDMLFLNAGIASYGTVELTEDGIERTFATNNVGHHLMYRLLEPSIFRSDDLRKAPARIIQTSSASSYDIYHPYKVATDLETLNTEQHVGVFGAYAPSKLAQILWARELTDQLDARTNSSKNIDGDPNSIVYVNAAHPGMVATNVWFTPFDKMPFGITAPIKSLLQAFTKIMWNCEEGALTLVYLGTATEDLQTKNIRGKYFHPQSIMVQDHIYASDNDPGTKILQEKLWAFLDELVADFL